MRDKDLSAAAARYAASMGGSTTMRIEIDDETMPKVLELAEAMKCPPRDLLSQIVRDLFKDADIARDLPALKPMLN